MREENTINRLQIMRNDLFGEIEVLQTKNQIFIAKKLTEKSISIFEKALKNQNFLFKNDFPFFQEFHSQTELFGNTYLLFNYYDFSLHNFHQSNQRGNILVPESMLLKLFNDIFYCLNFLKTKRLVYPLIHKKTIYINKQGNLKLVNPLLFEGIENYLGENINDETILFESNKKLGELAKLVLEQANLTDFSTGEDVSKENIVKALEFVKRNYSYEFFNFMRKMDYSNFEQNSMDSSLKNVNAAENYFNLNCNNIDKFLLGIKVNSTNKEMPKSFGISFVNNKDLSVSKQNDKKPNIFGTEKNNKNDTSFQNENILLKTLPNDSLYLKTLQNDSFFIKDGLPKDLPADYSNKNIWPSDRNVRIIEINPIQNQNQINRHVQSSIIQDFGKKSDHYSDPFFDDIFQKPINVEKVDFSRESQNKLQNNSTSEANLFNLPENFSDLYQHHVGHPLRNIPPNRLTSAENLSSDQITFSFKNISQNKLFSTENMIPDVNRFTFKDNGDGKRSKSSNVYLHVNGSFDQNSTNLVKVTQGNPVYVDSNESFSKKLAQKYQKEYAERNESMNASIVRLENQGIIYHSSPHESLVINSKAHEKSYAIIHDFPMNGK